MILVANRTETDAEQIFNARNRRENYFIVCYYNGTLPEELIIMIFNLKKKQAFMELYTQSKCNYGHLVEPEM